MVNSHTMTAENEVLDLRQSFFDALRDITPPTNNA
jgi:hypothetical protein